MSATLTDHAAEARAARRARYTAERKQASARCEDIRTAQAALTAVGRPRPWRRRQRAAYDQALLTLDARLQDATHVRNVAEAMEWNFITGVL